MKKVLKATKIFKSSKKEAKPNAFSGLTKRLSTASQNSTWDINSTFLCTSLGYNIDLTVELVDKRFTKLHKACWIGNEDKVKKHIKKIDVNSRDNENRLPLHLATAQGHKSIVEYLIAHKALIDVIDGDGRTPLMKAVECYHAHIVEFLLACGANGNLSDKYGDTSLHLAVKTGQPEVAFTLLKQRVDVNARNAEGWTPLHMATAQKQQNVVKYLLEMGALINSADEEGKTPLMLACKAENAPLVSLLLRSGANMEMQDNQGWTALDFAALTHKSEIIDMLTQNLKTAEEGKKENDPECGTHDQDTWNDNDSINEYLNLEKSEPEITIKEALPSPVLSSSNEHEAPTEADCLEPKERKHGSAEKEFAAVEQRKLDFLKEFGLSDPSEISTPEISSISDLKEKQDNGRSQNMHDETDIDQDLSTVDEVSQHQGGGRISEEIDAEKDNLISVPCLIDKDKLQPQSEVTKSFLKSDWMIAAHSSSESESEVEDIVSPSYIPSASVVRRRSSTHTDVSQTTCSPDVSPTKPPLSCLTTYHTSHPEQSPISCSPSHPIAPFIKNSIVDSPESPPSKHSYKNDHFSESPRAKTFGSTLSAEISPKDLMMKEDPALVDPLDMLTDSEWDSEDSAYSNEENIINKSMNKEENVLEKARDKKSKNMGDSTKIQDFYSEQPKETSCPESVEGTLGRPDTLQGSEEMWEKNAIVNVKDVKDTNESERRSSHPRKTPPKPPPRKTRRVTDEKLPFDVESSLTLTTSPEVEENQQITKLLQGDFDSTTDNEDSITEDSSVPKIPEISPETLRTASGFQQIQEILRKQYFISVKERHDKNNLKSRLNTLKCERSTLQSKLQAEKASHNGLQKKILTLEKELLELNYRIEQEKNSRMDAESLLKTVQNQLTSTLVAYNRKERNLEAVCLHYGLISTV
ncbi:uncharacterized protein LOC143258599 [Tachypleus tridentatus]|uniref:uncharacterized protein LOC143258599 n=1 Tax=Tachypleus tridentatus TaxID=6853 RepID=UPI003FD1139E